RVRKNHHKVAGIGSSGGTPRQELRGEFVVAAGAKHESYERADMARAHSLPSSPPIEAHHRLGMAMLAAWLLWQHRLVLGLATGFIPSAVVTLLLTQFADLDRMKSSTLGRSGEV